MADEFAWIQRGARCVHVRQGDPSYRNDTDHMTIVLRHWPSHPGVDEPFALVQFDTGCVRRVRWSNLEHAENEAGYTFPPDHARAILRVLPGFVTDEDLPSELVKLDAST